MASHLFVVRGRLERIAADARVRGARPGARLVDRVKQAARKLREPLHGRARPLIAVGGDETSDPAEMVHALEDLAATSETDLALLLAYRDAWIAAQRARTPPSLSPPVAAAARELAALARTGELTLFAGAGVSAAAGMPLWHDLLDALAREVGMTTGEREALRELHPLDRGRLLERRFGGRQKFADRVRAHFRGEQIALGHALLAALPVREIVTTNYDALLELASGDLDLAVSVLPESPVRPCDRWIFKIHGSVASEGDLVVTREDQLRFPDRRGALAGIVQALLITRHMLFVGFSLQDESFHRIADAVRRAIRPHDGQDPFGTVLGLRPRPLVEELWHGDLRFVSVAPEGTEDAAAAREIDVFLDALGCESFQPYPTEVRGDIDDALDPPRSRGFRGRRADAGAPRAALRLQGRQRR